MEAAMKTMNDSKRIKCLALLFAAGLLSYNASAQNQTTYFLDNYGYNYRYNPAIMSERSFFAVGLGNVSTSLGSNIGLSSLLYPSADGNTLVTGFNNSVSSQEFLSGIKDRNGVCADFNANLFSFVTRKEDRMTSFEINVKTLSDATISGDIFRLLKTGSADVKYDFSSTSVNLDSYVEIAFGRSRYNEDKKFGFGYRIKGIVGLGSAQVYFNDTQITSNEDQLRVNLNGQARIACPMVKFKLDDDGKISGLEQDTENRSLAGIGAAIDAGVVYNPVEGLSLSAAINDLGLVNWDYSLLAQSKGTVNFKGLDMSSENANYKDELDKVDKEFKDLANFGAKDGYETIWRYLPFNVNAGVRYRIPMAQIVSVGATASYQNSNIPVWESRFAATLSPCRWFSITGNYGYGTFGPVWGSALSVSASFLNFYIGIDGFSGPVGKYENIAFYPVNRFNLRLNTGLTIQLGQYH